MASTNRRTSRKNSSPVVIKPIQIRDQPSFEDTGLEPGACYRVKENVFHQGEVVFRKDERFVCLSKADRLEDLLWALVRVGRRVHTPTDPFWRALYQHVEEVPHTKASWRALQRADAEALDLSFVDEPANEDEETAPAKTFEEFAAEVRGSSHYRAMAFTCAESGGDADVPGKPRSLWVACNYAADIIQTLEGDLQELVDALRVWAMDNKAEGTDYPGVGPGWSW